MASNLPRPTPAQLKKLRGAHPRLFAERKPLPHDAEDMARPAKYRAKQPFGPLTRGKQAYLGAQNDRAEAAGYRAGLGHDEIEGLKKSHPLSEAQLRRVGQIGMATSGLALAGSGGAAGARVVGTARDRHRRKKTSKERGKAELAKAEAHLEEVAKNSYMRRTVRDPGSELDVLAAARMLLDSQHKLSHIPLLQRRQMRDQLRGAIARSYLNAPFTRSF